MVLKKILVAFCLGLCWAIAQSQETINIVATNTAGGPVDDHARAFSKVLKDNNITNIVTNMAGGGGDIAYNYVMSKKNTILFLSSATLVFANVPSNRPPVIANTMKLFGPITYNPLIMMSPTNGKFSNLLELIAAAKSNEVPCGVSNLHGQIQLQLMNKKYNLKFLPILYQGSSKLKPDLMGGQILCAFDQTGSYNNLENYIQILGISEQKNTNGVPAISNILPGYFFENYFSAAIPNDSPLLKNIKLVTLLNTWNQNKENMEPLINKGYSVTKIDPDLAIKVINETYFYQDLLKN